MVLIILKFYSSKDLVKVGWAMVAITTGPRVSPSGSELMIELRLVRDPWSHLSLSPATRDRCSEEPRDTQKLGL